MRAAPGAPALATRDTVWTYRELASAIDAAQRAFSGRSARRGSRIALLMSNTPQYVALYYGIMAAGRVAVPLNTQERRRLLTQQIKHCGASLLCGDPAHPQWAGVSVDAAEFGVDVMQVPRLTGPDAPAMFIDSLRASARGEPYMQTGPDEPAAIFFTSGTTGRPKGVVLSHRNLASNAEAIARYLELSSSDRGFCVLPTHSSYGNSVLNSHLVRGARLAFEDSLAFPQIIVQRMQDESITGFAGVPSTFNVLRAQTCLQNFDLRSLRYVTQAGSAMPRALITVATRGVTCHAAVPHVRTDRGHGTPDIPATRAAEREARVCGNTDRRSRGPGAAGWTPGGPDGGRGNSGSRSHGDARLLAGPGNDGAGTQRRMALHGGSRTSRLGGVPVHRRANVRPRRRGLSAVSPDEIEEVIASLSGVREVGVTAIADALLGHAIKAVIVGDGTLDAKRVQAHCREHLAGYKVPKIIEFAEALPRTASGKLQRSKLT